MKYLLTSLLLLCVSATAQLATPIPKDPAVKGAFYLSIDDVARIYINGIEAHKNASLGKSKSKDVALKPGDRIVVQLRNATMPRYFIMAFASTDKKLIVSFPRQSLKLLPDADATDFTEADFFRLSKYPKADSRKPDGSIPFKHNSDYVWGEFDNCALACTLTAQMFVPFRQ